MLSTADQNGVTRKVTKPKSKDHSEHLMKRVSRACLHCRQRKSRCDLDSSGSPGTPPCQRCLRDHRECVLGSSNRGGRRIRKPKITNLDIDPNSSGNKSMHLAPSGSSGPPDQHQFSQHQYPSDHFGRSDPPTTSTINIDDDDSASTTDSAIGSVPRNPSDAWQCLTNVAKRGAETANLDKTGEHYSDSTRRARLSGEEDDEPPLSGIDAYRLIKNGSLTRETVSHLVTRYAENFHPYLPLVPRKYFDPAALESFASQEKHLLTAVLTIASKDLVDTPQVHDTCSQYMHELISGIAAGIDCDVEAVEALLLLAEWEPQGLRPKIEAVGRGEEDRAAWMHVGLALRSGYFLGLDRTSFRGDPTIDAQVDGRKRLAWTSCYISDRLISVRIGRAFWSRGPGPMTGLVSQDFPSLQPLTSTDEDYAKIFQALLDLTQLYGNVHDVLYSGMRTSSQMMLMGDYVKYVDDFRNAIDRWNRIWGTLTCSPHIKVTLQMSYEYLRLYTNAFAFQAAISQALTSKPKGDALSQRDHLRAAFSNVASMQDARFIYASVDAAKSYLTILNNFVDPEKHLHFMPLRYYLYSIYAAVFLYKARSFGVMNTQEEQGVRHLINLTTDRLHRASAGPDDIGARYARLLELLWKSKSSSSSASSTNTQEPPRKDESVPAGAVPNRLPEQSYVQYSPMNDFSWLDLGAVGDYVSGYPIGNPGIIGMNSYQHPNSYPATSEAIWPVQSLQVDLNGNLFF
ncbi:hypothetical protein PABG_06000 [Paracoccidioides brasiliensis Pb03]|uniref:Zn(2)-C6 fungal-type domain-containing protein n=2 Tax=Paracoccidioides brasiliensis TaxID=121759 RepID=C1GHI4_PARBD|nr:uncharacterized protein PADG_06720 [Paracoccidioides brasiliensis Pb18]EEH15913.1 hypothetical protein PABG_06000 [Paracoccidioides brasiliensis Pb03]EEH50641.2 hypothetical protein PADG_06720 [Paracoccidioides brasiliensis Pb18]ODH38669.1 hypothetical protein ACO22_02236 [Paracoccidioides brasiliensis]ODH53302.1 hypothetical protein GX48_00498 [Paracoccidioides brasiliensis]